MTAKTFLALGRRGRRSWVKILCLGIGLAAGTVLIGKVGFETSFDDFFPASPRTYLVNETVVRDGEYQEYPQTAGAIAPGLHRYCPQVEAATRVTGVLSDFRVVTDDDRRLNANLWLADSCFFDVFPFRVLAGDPRQVLSRPQYCMLPRSLAQKLGGVGGVVGMKLYLGDKANLSLTVGGVYEDVPLNSCLNELQVLIAMPTITKLLWDGRDNWVGNDRYHSYVRLAPGATPAGLAPQIRQMVEENIDQEELRQAGLELGFTLTRLADQHTKSPVARRMLWILSSLAFVLIFCAVMNYLLIVVGGIAGRAQAMAVHKCYGAGHRDIFLMVLGESLTHLLLSLAVAALLLFLCRDTVEHLAGAPLATLLACGSNLWLQGGVVAVVLLLTWLVPGWLYARVPVAVAFRRHGQSHRRWKLLLLALQLASAAFLLTLLVVIHRQYALMVNDRPGYEYRDLALYWRRDLKADDRRLLVDELRKLSCVQSVTTSTALLTEWQNGDNISLPGDPREYLNVADLFFAGDDYFPTMDIPVLAGRTFTQGTDTLCEMMVSRSFDVRMRQLAGWDSSLGQQVLCSSFEAPFTIVGIYADVRLGSIASGDERPSVLTYHSTVDNSMPVVTVRFRRLTAESLAEANALADRLLPGRDVVLQPYTTVMTSLYSESRSFRTTVGIGGVVTLAIALIGLVGYLAGEVGRRQKEMALRKVNGARTADVLRLFLGDVLRVALPSVAAGAVAARLVAGLWLEQFSLKTPLPLWLFLGCALLVLAVILAVVALGCWRVARSNPVRYLKSE